MFGFDALGKLPLGALPDPVGAQEHQVSVTANVSIAASIAKSVRRKVASGVSTSALLGNFSVGKRAEAAIDAATAIGKADSITQASAVETAATDGKRTRK